MIGVNSVNTGRTPGGRYKVYVWGTVNGHCSDWRGCNNRYKPISGQPNRGWSTRAEAEAWAYQRFPGGAKEASEWARRAGDGNFLTDQKFIDLDFKDVPGMGAGDWKVPLRMRKYLYSYAGNADDVVDAQGMVDAAIYADAEGLSVANYYRKTILEEC